MHCDNLKRRGTSFTSITKSGDPVSLLNVSAPAKDGSLRIKVHSKRRMPLQPQKVLREGLVAHA